MTTPIAWVAGIGSRTTPDPFQRVIRRFAATLAARGLGLRSGGARGADLAWEEGMGTGPTQIFLASRQPGRPGLALEDMAPELVATATALAAAHHPAWHRIADYGRRLLTRNAFQVLGPQLDDPVAAVLCWALESRLEAGRVVDVAGGTGLAVRLASAHGIPVLNLALPSHLELARAWHRTSNAPINSLVLSLAA